MNTLRQNCGMQGLLCDRYEKSLVSAAQFTSDTFAEEDRIWMMDEDFWLLHQLEGTLLVTDDTDANKRLLRGDDLLVLTPSRRARISLPTSGAKWWVIRFAPDYFDSLPGGQLLYDRLTETCGEEPLPVVPLDAPYGGYMQRTATLFADPVQSFLLSGEELVRHLCSFCLLQVANALCRYGKTSAVGVRHRHEIYRNFKRLLLEYYRTEHRIGFYAERLNISPTYLSRIVRQVTGRTVHAHVAELLCTEARKWLEGSDRDVKEIAAWLGFSDQSAFGKFYQKHTGWSPVRFRRRGLHE